MPYEFLPTLNAMLNATSGVLVVSGYLLIRRKRVSAHRACMVGAVITTLVFLTSYIVYHAHHGVSSSEGRGMGWVRWLYLAILTSHTVLAVTIVPFVAVTLRRALRGDFARHKRIARWTFPMWVYVSVTGVLVYFMLYHWYPARP